MTLSAEDCAAKLSAWQVLDIAYVWRNGSMAYGVGAEPAKPLRELIEANILSLTFNRVLVVPGFRFNSILYALMRNGKIREPAPEAFS